MYGVVVHIILDYGDEQMMEMKIIDEQRNLIQRIDSDHVQMDGMYLVHENGDFW